MTSVGEARVEKADLKGSCGPVPSFIIHKFNLFNY